MSAPTRVDRRHWGVGRLGRDFVCSDMGICGARTDTTGREKVFIQGVATYGVAMLWVVPREDSRLDPRVWVTGGRRADAKAKAGGTCVSFSKVKEHKVLAADIPVVPLPEVQRKFWASGGLRPRLTGTRRRIRVVMRHSGQVPCRHNGPFVIPSKFPSRIGACTGKSVIIHKKTSNARHPFAKHTRSREKNPRTTRASSAAARSSLGLKPALQAKRDPGPRGKRKIVKPWRDLLP
ncbi:hypothetical protein DFH08DRAFT_801857 [Mycena albidolilacea]|uniref:Uncharacterized protein n=1 Tax=Mycena albidolilacea TaxID=1033008 RepID=A0AAD7AG45_9AGAR|nr:hypothetical protein DFH08DRAFT_801857 [Mycena albidolilacea]